MTKAHLDPSNSLACIPLHRIIGTGSFFKCTCSCNAHRFLEACRVNMKLLMEWQAVWGCLLDNEAVRPAYGRVLYFYGVPCWLRMCRWWRITRRWECVESSGECTLRIIDITWCLDSSILTYLSSLQSWDELRNVYCSSSVFFLRLSLFCLRFLIARGTIWCSHGGNGSTLRPNTSNYSCTSCWRTELAQSTSKIPQKPTKCGWPLETTIQFQLCNPTSSASGINIQFPAVRTSSTPNLTKVCAWVKHVKKQVVWSVTWWHLQ